MKKRLLSILLFAAMLMTLMSTAAFAAEGEPVIEGAWFYADAVKASEKVEEIIGKINNDVLSNNAAEMLDKQTAVKGIEDNTLIVWYDQSLGTAYNYTLKVSGENLDEDIMIELPKGERGDTKPTPTEQNKLNRYLCIINLPEEITKNSDGAILKADKYTVELTKENESDSSETMEVELVNTTIDFGPGATPAEFVQSEKEDKFYQTSVSTDPAEVQAQITFLADKKDFSDVKRDPYAVINNLIRIDDEDVDFEPKDQHAWRYDDSVNGTASFSWRAELPAENVKAAFLDNGIGASGTVDKLYTDYRVTVKSNDQDKNKNLKSSATVYIEATDLAKHKGSQYGTGLTEDAYWIGFAVTVPEGTVSARYGTESTDMAEAAIQEIEEDERVVSFYVDAEKATKEKSFFVQFYGEGGIALTDVYELKADISGVELNTTAAVRLEKGENGEFAASVDDKVMAEQLTAADANHAEFVTIDATRSDEDTRDASVKVTITRDAAAQLAEKQLGLIIKTPYGAVKISEDNVSKVVTSTGSVTLEMRPCTLDLLNSCFTNEMTGNDRKIDSCLVRMYQGSNLITEAVPFELTLNFDWVTKNNAAVTDEDELLWALEFSEKDKSGKFEKPVIINKTTVEKNYDSTSKAYLSASFDVSKFGAYGVARKSFVDQMNAIDNDAAIKVFPSADLTEAITLCDEAGKEVAFDTERLSYTLKTEQPKVWITAVDGARYVDAAGVDQLVPKSGWVLELKEQYTTAQIKIGNKTYAIRITKRPSEELTLGKGKHYDGINFDRIEITNAEVGRQYLVQITNEIKASHAQGTVHCIIEKSSAEESAWFLAPTPNAARTVTINVYEINSEAQDIYDAKGFVYCYDEDYTYTNASEIKKMDDRSLKNKDASTISLIAGGSEGGN